VIWPPGPRRRFVLEPFSSHGSSSSLVFLEAAAASKLVGLLGFTAESAFETGNGVQGDDLQHRT
jgi:hypothetical protein